MSAGSAALSAPSELKQHGHFQISLMNKIDAEIAHKN